MHDHISLLDNDEIMHLYGMPLISTTQVHGS